MGWAMCNCARYLGYLTGAIAFFNLVHRHWLFDLSAFFLQLREFYQAIFHPIANVIASLIYVVISISVPADVVVLWLLGWAANARLLVDTFGRGEEPDDHVMLVSFLLITMILWPVVLWSMLKTDNSELAIEWFYEVVKIVIAFVAFFVLNAVLS
jgi:hypothetical protein